MIIRSQISTMIKKPIKAPFFLLLKALGSVKFSNDLIIYFFILHEKNHLFSPFTKSHKNCTFYNKPCGDLSWLKCTIVSILQRPTYAFSLSIPLHLSLPPSHFLYLMASSMLWFGFENSKFLTSIVLVDWIVLDKSGQGYLCQLYGIE